jgi:hypothetical protein
MRNFFNALGRGLLVLVQGAVELLGTILQGVARGMADALATLLRSVGPWLFGFGGLYAFWRYNPAGTEELIVSLMTLGVALFGLAIIVGYQPGKKKSKR